MSDRISDHPTRIMSIHTVSKLVSLPAPYAKLYRPETEIRALPRAVLFLGGLYSLLDHYFHVGCLVALAARILAGQSRVRRPGRGNRYGSAPVD